VALLESRIASAISLLIEHILTCVSCSPHRGQETITYLLQGAVDHEDFAGNAGTIEVGDLQFMTAGKGIMHAEMPRQNADGSANIGMQLWVDLPEKLKKCEPRYRDLRASEIPNIDVDEGKVHIKIISGQSHGVDSVQELAYTPVWILDMEIKPGGKVQQPFPAGWNAFAYTLSGSTAFGVGSGRTIVGQFHNVVFEQKGDEIVAEVEADAKENGHFSKSPDLVRQLAYQSGFPVKVQTFSKVLWGKKSRLSESYQILAKRAFK
jgi:redox-sensitive bicupin YhaK (pirin superfamily)